MSQNIESHVIYPPLHCAININNSQNIQMMQNPRDAEKTEREKGEKRRKGLRSWKCRYMYNRVMPLQRALGGRIAGPTASGAVCAAANQLGLAAAYVALLVAHHGAHAPVADLAAALAAARSSIVWY